MLTKSVNCFIEQKCTFSNIGWNSNTDDGDVNYIYSCRLSNLILVNESETVITNTSSNTQLDSEVQAVNYYSGSIIKFFPSSLFTTFPNLEWLVFETSQSVDTLKPHFFQNGTNLKVLWIHFGELFTLNASTFVLAPNLERINFQHNKIESIDRLTFQGLTKLRGLYMQGNPIVNLFPDTFSSLVSLDSLSMLNSQSCCNKRFENSSQKIWVIESEIEASCKYEEHEGYTESNEFDQGDSNSNQSLNAKDLLELIREIQRVIQIVVEKIEDIRYSVENNDVRYDQLVNNLTLLQLDVNTNTETLRTKSFDLGSLKKIKFIAKENSEDIKDLQKNLLKSENTALDNFSSLVKIIHDHRTNAEKNFEFIVQGLEKRLKKLEKN